MAPGAYPVVSNLMVAKSKIDQIDQFGGVCHRQTV
jgi:hypothetical protein